MNIRAGANLSANTLQAFALGNMTRVEPNRRPILWDRHVRGKGKIVQLEDWHALAVKA